MGRIRGDSWMSDAPAGKELPRLVETNVAMWACVPDLPVEALATIRGFHPLALRLHEVGVTPRTPIDEAVEEDIVIGRLYSST